MKLEMQEAKELVSVPEDVYLAEICRVEELTLDMKYGETLRISFRIVEGAHAGKEIASLAKAVLTPNSKLAKWSQAAGIDGLKTGDAFETDELVGRRVRIATKNKTVTRSNGESAVVSNVEVVYPA